jgi:hypothetical protein
MAKTRHIGVLNEGALHAALKAQYLGAEGQAEVSLGDFVADVLCDGVVYEIQTSSFSGLARKMRALAERFPVVLVHPIPQAKYLLRLRDSETGEFTRRRSPKRGATVHILRELVYIPELLNHPNFAVEAVLTEEEELQTYDPKARRGRGGWRRKGRHLLDVVERYRLSSADDLWAFVSDKLPEEFTTQDLAAAMGQPKALAQQMAYCLRHLGAIDVRSKIGNSLVYRRVV